MADCPLTELIDAANNMMAATAMPNPRITGRESHDLHDQFKAEIDIPSRNIAHHICPAKPRSSGVSTDLLTRSRRYNLRTLTRQMTRESEAAALRDEWVRLQKEGDVLAEATERLTHSEDPAALRAHQERLHEHQTQLHALTNALENFHHTYGAVGGLRAPQSEGPSPTNSTSRDE